MYDFQKANMWKRISAALFDLILIAIGVIGMAFLLSTALGYDSYVSDLEKVYDKYEDNYGVDFDITAAQYDALSEEERENYDSASKAVSEDKEAVYIYGMLINFTLIIIIFSILFAYLLFEFLVPLLFKNGQTLGKKVFGIGVMREDGVKISPLLLFARTVLGKYTLETMIPVLIIVMTYFGSVGIFGTAVIGLLLLVQIIMISSTKANTPIHDKLAHTVTVDMASQMIFDTPEDMLLYKQRIHAQEAEKADY